MSIAQKFLAFARGSPKRLACFNTFQTDEGLFGLSAQLDRFYANHQLHPLQIIIHRFLIGLKTLANTLKIVNKSQKQLDTSKLLAHF